jgi:septum formation topological specificity factor MinE
VSGYNIEKLTAEMLDVVDRYKELDDESQVEVHTRNGGRFVIDDVGCINGKLVLIARSR